MDGERLVGTSSGSGGECRFAPGTEVLTGEFQGNVLVGTVRLCLQGGAECTGPQDVPVMAIYNPQSTTLSALFRLKAGCSSPALTGTQLVLRRVSGSIEQEEEAPAPKAGGAGEQGAAVQDAAVPAGAMVATQGSAASAAAMKLAETRRPQSPRFSVEEGQTLLAAGKSGLAKTHFEAALEQDGRNVDALVGLAACELGQGNARKALEALERVKVGASRPDVFAWQARAHGALGDKPRALQLVRKAMLNGWSPSTPRPWETQLVKELGSEIEQAKQSLPKGKRLPPGRESMGAGSTSP
ncbi:tetratricopeptide repeat protein [Myxococcus stipitatus]|uniref:tetratricopeptide repeat protein n=1 Tax=Myxococcus stipitatus TaxID=83455 RepID=UPI001F15ADE9|nr:tetratricopeptide repeat protein [Myxococcus stipitatus]MCE9667250.1 tetratricopeptide repeat protein [Myxococcus stipitatus]